CGQQVTQLPPGATLLASTATTKNACYKVGIRTFGALFHFECDRPMVTALFKSDPAFLAKTGKTVGDLEAEADKHYAGFARVADRLCVTIVTTLFPKSRR
ncbi:MAG: hypothetical protein ACOYN0_10460, partial [Phycisphaerales bacterium]